MFIAKDGFLLYYGEKTNPNASHFDTKPKVRKEIVGPIPLPLTASVAARDPGRVRTHPSWCATRTMRLHAAAQSLQLRRRGRIPADVVLPPPTFSAPPPPPSPSPPVLPPRPTPVPSSLRRA
jgi:hypothetical protein